MFDGNIGNRKVTVSGKKKELLSVHDARKQRELRAMEKSYAMASTKIQSAYRRCLSNKMLRKEYQNKFDKMISDIKKLKMLFKDKNQIDFIVPIETLCQLIQLIIFFYPESKTKQDQQNNSNQQRLIDVIILFNESLSLPNGKNNILTQTFEQRNQLDNHVSNVYRFKQFIGLLLNYILPDLHDMNKNNLDMNSILLIMNTISILTTQMDKSTNEQFKIIYISQILCEYYCLVLKTLCLESTTSNPTLRNDYILPFSMNLIHGTTYALLCMKPSSIESQLVESLERKNLQNNKKKCMLHVLNYLLTIPHSSNSNPVIALMDEHLFNSKQITFQWSVLLELFNQDDPDDTLLQEDFPLPTPVQLRRSNWMNSKQRNLVILNANEIYMTNNWKKLVLLSNLCYHFHRNLMVHEHLKFVSTVWGGESNFPWMECFTYLLSNLTKLFPTSHSIEDSTFTSWKKLLQSALCRPLPLKSILSMIEYKSTSYVHDVKYGETLGIQFPNLSSVDTTSSDKIDMSDMQGSSAYVPSNSNKKIGKQNKISSAEYLESLKTFQSTLFNKMVEHSKETTNQHFNSPAFIVDLLSRKIQYTEELQFLMMKYLSTNRSGTDDKIFSTLQKSNATMITAIFRFYSSQEMTGLITATETILKLFASREMINLIFNGLCNHPTLQMGKASSGRSVPSDALLSDYYRSLPLLVGYGNLLMNFQTERLNPLSPVGNDRNASNINYDKRKDSDELSQQLINNLAFLKIGGSTSLARYVWDWMVQYWDDLDVIQSTSHSMSLLQLICSNMDEHTLLNHPNFLIYYQTFSITTSSYPIVTTNYSTPQQFYYSILTILYFFTTIFHQHLTVIDDEELFTEQTIFSVTQLQSITSFLCQILFKFYWLDNNTNDLVIALNPTSSKTHHSNAYISISERARVVNSIESMDVEHERLNANLIQLQCKLSATKLFNALCIRNERRTFLSPEHRLWKRFDDNYMELLSDANSGLTTQDDENDEFRFRNPKIKTILLCLPQVLHFDQRVTIFQQLLDTDKTKYYVNYSANNGGGLAAAMGIHEGVTIKVHRDKFQLFNDAFEGLINIGDKLKGRVQVEFTSEQGLQEAGIDGGGLFKEFMHSLSKAAFDPTLGLFKSTPQQLLTPNPLSVYSNENYLEHFYFIGRMIGKSLYEKILIESEFSGGFLNILLGRSNQIDDLYYLDEELYKSLMKLKHDALRGIDVESLELYFETTREGMGEYITEELIPGGFQFKVDNSNVFKYIHYLANHKQNKIIASQCQAFQKGFRTMIPIKWMRMFNINELQLLICGDHRRINVEDMKMNVNYLGYALNEPYIQAFWKIIDELSSEDQANLLKFVTSCPRQPLLGFAQLNPKFAIQKVPTYETNVEAARLPSAATCMNLLKLPCYDSIELLRDKLLYAIRSNSGFELS